MVSTTETNAATSWEQPGWISRWFGRDPVRSVAVVMILVCLVWRIDLGIKGYYSQDEYYIAFRAEESELTVDFLLGIFNNHLMPAGMLVAWLVTKATGLAYWPYGVLMALGQLVFSIASFRLLRQIMKPGWVMLLPLFVMLYSPLTLEASSLWVVGLLTLPIHISMVLAIGAQVKYVRTRRIRHLFSLALAVAFGLAFTEKALLIIPLIFVMTVCLFCIGGPVRAIFTAIGRYWPSWLVLTAITGGYVSLYLNRTESSLQQPETVGGIIEFLRDIIGSTTVPGLFGGPWRWLYAGDGPPPVAPYEVGMWLSWIALFVLIVITSTQRRIAGRAWTMFLIYVLMVAALFAATRLGNPLSGLAGMITRYVSEVAVLFGITFGIALTGLNEDLRRDVGQPLGEKPWPWPAVLREPAAVAVGTVTAVLMVLTLVIGTLWSTARFSDSWETKISAGYMETAHAELKTAPPDIVFFDGVVPTRVMEGYWWPYNRHSSFLRMSEHQPVFVTHAEQPYTFDDEGRIRPIAVDGIFHQPGPDPDCGYRVADGQPTRVPMQSSADPWHWVIVVGYLSSGESTMRVRLGTTVTEVPIHRGLRSVYLQVEGGGDTIELTVLDPTVSLCTNHVVIGPPTPAQQ